MKKLFLILVSAFALVGCENSEVSNGRKFWKAYLHKNLKDPTSLVIYNEKYTIENNGLTIKWEIDYGAKNGFGGMGRETLNCTTTPNLICIGTSDGCFDKEDLGL